MNLTPNLVIKSSTNYLFNINYYISIKYFISTIKTN